MRWTAEDILEANPIMPGQDRSVLERLIATGQVDLKFAAEVADEIESRPQPHIAAFFQLPYAVCVERGWHRIDTLEEGLFAEFTFRPFELFYTDSGTITLREVSGEARSWPVVTQVAALFPIWGRRARFHAKYLHHVERGSCDNPMIIPQGESWIDNRPIFLGDYETNLARRLIREVQAALRRFLPAYAIASMSEAQVPDWLYAYYAMPAPGRIVPAGSAIAVTKALVRRAIQAMPPVLSFAQISPAMTTKFRVFGRFEAQLFAMERLRREGEVALALIGGISLLEWVLKAIVDPSGITKFKGLAEAISHPSIDFLSATDRDLVQLVRRARNALVHEEPPPRRSLTIAGATAHPHPLGGKSRCSSDDVRALLELAFSAFKEANRRGIKVGAFET